MAKKSVIALMAASLLLCGCASKPTYVEYYEPATAKEREAGHGAVKAIDYRKPSGDFTIFSFSIM